MRRGFLLGLRAGVVVATLTTTAACSGSSPSSPLGIVADAGFRPNSNGFTFENYGQVLASGLAPTNLTASDVEALFGSQVCADAKLRRCDLIPEAQAWLTSTNQAMAGGHCYGFSVLAELIWQRKLSVTSLGAPAPSGLVIDENQALQRQIAYDWALQTLDSVQDRRVTGTPDQILAELRQVLKPNPPETYTIAIWKRDGTGGHAVTPYAVRNDGGGKFDVLIYDNNWPGQNRAISFDIKANTWTYHAAVNPNVPDSVYEGDAQTKTISLFPTSPGLGTQPCPFCAKVPSTVSSSGGGSNAEEITLQGGDTNHANVVVTDDAGHRLGHVGGKLVQEIRGGRAEQLISNDDWTDRIEPDFFVPADARYRITLDGAALKSPDTETLRVIGPSFDVSVDNIPMRPGEKDTLVIESDATRLSYASSRPESPTLQVGVSDNQAEYAFEVAGISDRPGSTTNIGLPPEGDTLTLQTVGSARAASVNFKVTRETERGIEVFQHKAIPLGSGDAARVQFGSWAAPTGTMPLVTVHDGQQSTQDLANQASA